MIVFLEETGRETEAIVYYALDHLTRFGKIGEQLFQHPTGKIDHITISEYNYIFEKRPNFVNLKKKYLKPIGLSGKTLKRLLGGSINKNSFLSAA